MRTFLNAACVSAVAVTSFMMPASARASGPAPASIQPGARDDVPLPQDPRHVTGELSNGLRYVIVRHGNPPERGLVWLHVNTGSLNEEPTQRGSARMIQRLAFAGSKNFAGQPAVAQMLQTIGSQPNIDAVSHSTFEETVFKLAIRQASAPMIDKALTFLADIPTDLVLADADFERERGTLIDQIKQLSTSETRIQNQIWQKFAPGSKFGDRIPDAPESVFKSLTRDACLAYYRTWYVPSNMTLIVAADADPAPIEAMIKLHFESLPKSPRPAPADLNLKPYAEPFAFIATDPEMKATQFYLFRLIPPYPPTRTESQLRDKLVQSVAIGVFNRRLGEKIAGGKVSFVSGSALAVDIANVRTLAAINASTEIANWKRTLESLATEVQRVRLHGFSEADVDSVKKQYAAAAEQGLRAESSKVLGTVMGGIAQTVNNGDVYMSAEQTVSILNKLLPGITKAELEESFRAVFDPEHAAFVLATAGGPGTPTESELLAAAKAAFSVKPTADADAAKPTALMTSLPTPGKIAAQSTHEKTGSESWTLENGIIINFKNLATKPNVVNVTISLSGGLIQETRQNHGITELASLALNRPATSRLTTLAIQDLMQGKEVTIRASSGVDALVLGISGKSSDIESGLQVAHLVLTDPFIEPPGFDQWRRTAIDDAQQKNQNIQAAFNDAVHDAIFPDSEFLLESLSEKEVSALTIDDGTRWLKQLASTAPIEVAIVGDISKEEAQRLATVYLGSLPKRDQPSPDRFQAQRALQRPAGPRVIEREVSPPADMPMDRSYLMLGFYGADESNSADRRALFIARAILEARLTRSLRDTDKLVPGIQVRFDAGQEFTGFGLFRAMAAVEPDKVDLLAKRIDDTFKSFAEVGPTPEELEGVRSQAIKSIDEVQKDPGYWTGELSLVRQRGKNLDDTAAEKAGYESITAADVKRVFAKYYGNGAASMVKVVLRRKPSPTAPAAPLP
ncbi:MAG: M16 family metallopeptidase [Phycisphaerales bacterium]